MRTARPVRTGLLVALLALLAPGLAQPCVPPPDRAAVDAILRRWEERVAPGLRPDERARIERLAAAVPVGTATGAPAITFEEEGVDVRPVAQRRDWVYALEGFHATLLGGTAAGADDLLDLGLWAFLRAARLEPEADHLANVAFHLNDRGAVNDAAALLCFARERAPLHAGVHANLAFALAELGDYPGAVAEQASAVALRPGEARTRARLTRYAELAGLELEVPDRSYGDPPPPPSIPALGSDGGASTTMFGEIFGESVAFLQRRAGVAPGGGYAHLDLVADFRAADAVYIGAVDAAEREAARCHQRCGEAGPAPTYPTTACSCACEIPRLQREWRATLQAFFDIAELIERYERAELRDLQAARDRMLAILARYQAEPDSAEVGTEVRAAQRWIAEWYLQGATLWSVEPWRAQLAGYLRTAGDLRSALEEAQRACGEAARDALPPLDPADLFGLRPRTLVLRELNPASREVWHIWFGFGSLDLHPDDTAALSLGLGDVLNARFRYNFRTHEYGSGVGIGLNLGKALGPLGGAVFKNSAKFEFFAEIDSERGPSAGLETGLNPRVGVLHTDQELVLRLEN